MASLLLGEELRAQPIRVVGLQELAATLDQVVEVEAPRTGLSTLLAGADRLLQLATDSRLQVLVVGDKTQPEQNGADEADGRP